MAKQRYWMVYLKTNGLREFFNITKGFDIIELTSHRRTGDEKDTNYVYTLGAKFGKKTDSYMKLSHKKKMPALNLHKDELIEWINKYGLQDAAIESATIISREPMSEIEDRVVLKLSSQCIKEDKLEKEYDSLPYNTKLSKIVRKKSILGVTQAYGWKEGTTFKPSQRNYLVNLRPNWRDHQLNLDFPKPEIALGIRDLFGHKNSFVGTYKMKGTKGFVLDGVE